MQRKKVCKLYMEPDYPRREVFAGCRMCAGSTNERAKSCAQEATLYAKELYNHDMCWHPAGKK